MDSKYFQDFIDDIQSLTKEKVAKWLDVIINMMGPSSKTTDEWNSIFKTQITELYDEMICEAIAKRDSMLNKIEELLKKSSILCKELNIKIPDYGAEGLTLYEEQEFLANKVKEYEEKIHSIQEQIKKLNKQEENLCNSLGNQLKPLPLQPLPSKDAIQKFKSYLDHLESKKFEREEVFLNLKAEIVLLAEELKYKPCLDFERIVVSSDDSSFLVTDTNMEKLNHFLTSLKQQYEDIKERSLILREKLGSLWELLNEDRLRRDLFLKQHKEINFKTLTALEEEVKRCEDLKKANIEVFVQRLRKELVTLWDKCHFTEQDRNNFEYFTSDSYSEDLLSIHDLEIGKMKKFYSTNCDLFQLIENRSELWSRMLELEESALMPGRFKNRGGQLLKEEKERNRLEKRIPKIEEQLIHLANTYQSKYGKPFYSWGKTVTEIIEEAHHARDEDKKFRSSARKQKRDQTPSKLTFGMTSSVSTQNLVSITPKSAVKRKLLTPFENISRTAPTKGASNKRNGGRTKYSIEKAKRMDKARRISYRMLQKQLGKENISSEYDMFEKDLGSKEGCRSTVFLESEESNNFLAVPLPVTPNARHLDSAKKRKMINTPGKPKLSKAPSLKTLF